ncbi:hypothetical protein MUGA111182_07590 [Mucilaginibacter galii]
MIDLEDNFKNAEQLTAKAVLNLLLDANFLISLYFEKGIYAV